MNEWTITTIDFTQAYLNAKLSEELWVTLPGKSVKKLERALYGLKQAGLQWNRTYTDAIIQREHWKRSNHDDCLFYALNPKGQQIAIVWLYVDDSALMGDWEEETLEMKSYPLKRFPGRDLGIMKNYVGMQVEYTHEGGIFVHQKDYAKKLVTEFLGQAARTAKTPLEKGADMSAVKKGEEALNLEKHSYRRALGQILYLATTTRPDLSTSARENCHGQLSTYNTALEIPATCFGIYIYQPRIRTVLPKITAYNIQPQRIQ